MRRLREELLCLEIRGKTALRILVRFEAVEGSAQQQGNDSQALPYYHVQGGVLPRGAGRTVLYCNQGGAEVHECGGTSAACFRLSGLRSQRASQGLSHSSDLEVLFRVDPQEPSDRQTVEVVSTY